MRYEVSVEGDERALPPYVGNQVFLILREAIRNAVAHSVCKRVTVALEVNPSEVTGSVEDDGLGFEADGDTDGGVGLRAMRERVALIGCALHVSSEPEAGTKVTVYVPLEKEDA